MFERNVMHIDLANTPSVLDLIRALILTDD